MQEDENVVFIFEKCSYEELQAIQHREDLLLSGWTLLEKEYIDVTEKVYDEVFGRSAVTELLGLKNSSASKLLSNLVQADIIEPVSGYGKGK